MKNFQINRSVDPIGVSGTGIIAEGVVFENGKVVVCWLGPTSTIVVHENIESVIKIHCSHGGTTIQYI